MTPFLAAVGAFGFVRFRYRPTSMLRPVFSAALGCCSQPPGLYCGASISQDKRTLVRRFGFTQRRCGRLPSPSQGEGGRAQRGRMRVACGLQRTTLAQSLTGNPSSAPVCALGHLPPSRGKALGHPNHAQQVLHQTRCRRTAGCTGKTECQQHRLRPLPAPHKGRSHHRTWGGQGGGASRPSLRVFLPHLFSREKRWGPRRV